MVIALTRDPNGYIQASADALAETLLSKNSDYAPTGEFSNFERAAEFSGVTPLTVMLSQIAIKYTRIQGLYDDSGKAASNEPLVDSLLDLAGYAIIAHAYLTHEQEPGSTDFIANRETIRNAMDEYQEASTAIREAMERA
jgi:hypothetical protein